MTFTFVLSRDDDTLETALRFLLKHRTSLYPNCRVQDIYRMLSTILYHGDVLLAVDEAGAVAGGACYMLEPYRADEALKHTARVEMLYLEPSLRQGRVLVRGMEQLMCHVLERAPSVQTFDFYCPAEERDFGKLFGRFMRKKSEYENRFGRVEIYTASMAAMREYVSHIL